MSDYTKKYIGGIVNFLLETGTSYFMWNGTICRIFPGAPSLGIVAILGLEFVISWLKLRPAEISFKLNNENNTASTTFAKTIVFATYFVIALVIYIILRYM